MAEIFFYLVIHFGQVRYGVGIAHPTVGIGEDRPQDHWGFDFFTHPHPYLTWPKWITRIAGRVGTAHHCLMSIAAVIGRIQRSSLLSIRCRSNRLGGIRVRNRWCCLRAIGVGNAHPTVGIGADHPPDHWGFDFFIRYWPAWMATPRISPIWAVFCSVAIRSR